MFRKIIDNQEGIGLITAVFIIVVVAMFGVLIARYTMVSSQASAEDYLWSQALYSAESAAQLRILQEDGGGGGFAWTNPTVNLFTTSVSPDPPAAIGASAIKQFTSQASRATITRTIEVRYTL